MKRKAKITGNEEINEVVWFTCGNLSNVEIIFGPMRVYTSMFVPTS
jgi:hypothetical protein